MAKTVKSVFCTHLIYERFLSGNKSYPVKVCTVSCDEYPWLAKYRFDILPPLLTSPSHCVVNVHFIFLEKSANNDIFTGISVFHAALRTNNSYEKLSRP